MIIVTDTSPLNYLILIGSIEVLPKMFGRIYAPSAVVVELSHPRSPGPVRAWAASPPEWLHIEDPAVIDYSLNLDPGEAAAIALAEELQADRLLIDERDGRDVAKRCGLLVVGSLGVLNEAAELDLIDLPHAIKELGKTSFHAREDLIEDILRLDQERKLARERARARAQDAGP